MKKYKYQCDNASCSKKFVASNPTNCPTCTSDDFTLIGEPNKLWLWLSILFLFVAAILWFMIYGIAPSKEFHYTIEEVENYIQINTPEDYNFDNANFVLTDKTNNQQLQQDGNKFYPCYGSGIKIIIECSDSLLKGEKNIEHYRFPPDITANEEFCSNPDINNKAPQFLDPSTKTDCPDGGIKVFVDDAAGEVEYSIDKRKFFKGKNIWTKEELGDARRVYVRFVGQKEINTSKRFKKCPPIKSSVELSESKNTLNNLLYDFLKDPDNKRKQLTDWLRKNDFNKVIFYIDGERLGGISSFTTRVKSELRSRVEVNKWSVREIIDDKQTIVKVKIKK